MSRHGAAVYGDFYAKQRVGIAIDNFARCFRPAPPACDVRGWCDSCRKYHVAPVPTVTDAEIWNADTRKTAVADWQDEQRARDEHERRYRRGK